MRHLCSKVVHAFLKRHVPPGADLVLAYSGGPDSTALLHLLRDSPLPFRLRLAHIDHGWRDPDPLDPLGFPLEVHKLSLDPTAPNAEERAREARYNVLCSLPCDAILLGHHKGDLAETVLKRVLEGASLPKLYGMRPIDTLYGRRILRPLLSLSKGDLLDYLGDASYAIDPTNDDPRFLRSRMRAALFPAVERHFGKGIAAPLSRLSRASDQLSRYLDKKIARYWDHFTEGTLDLKPLQPIEPVELRHFVATLARENGQTMSAEMLDTIEKIVEKGDSGRRVAVGELLFTLDRQKLKTNLQSFATMNRS